MNHPRYPRYPDAIYLNTLEDMHTPPFTLRHPAPSEQDALSTAAFERFLAAHDVTLFPHQREMAAQFLAWAAWLSDHGHTEVSRFMSGRGTGKTFLFRRLEEFFRQMPGEGAKRSPRQSDPPKAVQSCNRHKDCAIACDVYLAKHGRLPAANFHCYDETCEDCFGS